jgi:hypothetical protein
MATLRPVDYDPFAAPTGGVGGAPSFATIAPGVAAATDAPALPGEFGGLKPRVPSTRDNIGAALIDQGLDPRMAQLAVGSRGAGTSAMSVADLTPVGAALGLEEGLRSDASGLDTGLGIAGALPIPALGGGLRAAVRGGKAAVNAAADVAGGAARAARRVPFPQVEAAAEAIPDVGRTVLPFPERPRAGSPEAYADSGAPGDQLGNYFPKPATQRAAGPPLAKTPEITGSMSPLDNKDLTFRGKQPAEWTAEDYADIGDQLGIPNLGPATPPVAFKYQDGSAFEIPGGLDGKFTYWDMLSIKAQGIDPSRIDPKLHAEIQKKILRSVTDDAGASDAQVWSGLMFGMTSPNNPLFPNQLSASRLRLRDPKMLDDLSSMISWKPGEEVSAAVRKKANDEIARKLGLGAGSGGGLGTRGTADYTRIAELAAMFKKNPEFFRKGPNEQWDHFVERVSSQVAGLSMKTGSFATVWQDPAKAAISAIDRHMAQQFERAGGLFRDEAQRLKWENGVVKKWNEENPNRSVDSFYDLRQTDGADGHIGYELLQYVGDAKHKKLRTKGGDFGKDVPARMREANWVVEPDKYYQMGEAYRRALDLNDAAARKSGLGLFGSQWMEWDRIRRRLEPHENMFPGLERMPAPSVEQLKTPDAEHLASGHKNYEKVRDEAGVVSLRPTKPRPNPAPFGYFGLGAATVGGAGAAMLGGSDDANAADRPVNNLMSDWQRKNLLLEQGP